MIRDFGDDETRKIFLGNRSLRFPAEIQRAAKRKLVMLNAAEFLQDLRAPPGNRLERLSGDRQGQHSIRVNDRWRICFRWIEEHVYDVEIIDYL